MQSNGIDHPGGWRVHIGTQAAHRTADQLAADHFVTHFDDWLGGLTDVLMQGDDQNLRKRTHNDGARCGFRLVAREGQSAMEGVQTHRRETQRP